MPRLRNTHINQILQNLQWNDFCLEDFEVNFPDDGSILASIIFIAYPNTVLKFPKYILERLRLLFHC
jgi:hypothetical protein